MTDRFIAVPVTLDMMSMLIERAASITVGIRFGVIFLEGFLGHEICPIFALRLRDEEHARPPGARGVKIMGCL